MPEKISQQALAVDELALAAEALHVSARMNHSDMSACNSLGDIRSTIGRIERRIVAFLAERDGYVEQAAMFEKSADDVAVLWE